MKERPILFSGPMVRAIRDGHKTQTRRVIDPRLIITRGDFRFLGTDALKRIHCPYGAPGDRLWVREAWAYYGGDEYLYQQEPGAVSYRADAWDPIAPIPGGRWRPSIHMPRWASRLTLEVTEVRVQRLQDISEEDALAEIGVDPTQRMLPGSLALIAAACVRSMPSVTRRRFLAGGLAAALGFVADAKRPSQVRGGFDHFKRAPTAREAFAILWDSINAKRGYSWESNPPVWAITYKVAA